MTPSSPRNHTAKKRKSSGSALRSNAFVLTVSILFGLVLATTNWYPNLSAQVIDLSTHEALIKSVTELLRFDGLITMKPGKWTIGFQVAPPKQVAPGETYIYVVRAKSRIAPKYQPDRDWTLMIYQSPSSRFVQRIDLGGNIGTRCTQTYGGFSDFMQCDMLGVTDELYYMMATVSENAPCGSEIVHTASAEGYKDANSPDFFKFQKIATSTVTCPKKSESDLAVSITGNFLNKKTRQVLDPEVQKNKINAEGSILEQRFVVKNTGKKAASKVILTTFFQPLVTDQGISRGGYWTGFLTPFFITDSRCKLMNQFMTCSLGTIAPGKETVITVDLEATPFGPTRSRLWHWNMYLKNKAAGLCPNVRLICEFNGGLPDGDPVTYSPASTHVLVRSKEQDADQSNNAAIGHWLFVPLGPKFVDLRHQAFFTKETIGAGEETTLVLYAANQGTIAAPIKMEARATVRVAPHGASRVIGTAFTFEMRGEDTDICRLKNYGLTNDTIACSLILKPGESRTVKVNIKMAKEKKCLPLDKKPPILVLAELPQIFPGSKLFVESWAEGPKQSPPLLYANPYAPRSNLEIPVICEDAATKAKK